MQPRRLEDIARECREVYLLAVMALGPELCGYSPLDLLADQFPTIPLRTLQDAAVVAGIPGIPSERRY